MTRVYTNLMYVYISLDNSEVGTVNTGPSTSSETRDGTDQSGN